MKIISLHMIGKIFMIWQSYCSNTNNLLIVVYWKISFDIFLPIWEAWWIGYSRLIYKTDWLDNTTKHIWMIFIQIPGIHTLNKTSIVTIFHWLKTRRTWGFWLSTLVCFFLLKKFNNGSIKAKEFDKADYYLPI